MGTRHEGSMPRAVRRVVTAAVERGVASAGIAVVRALDRDVIGQGHHPRGVAGSVTGWVFAHRPSNRQRNGWVVSLLGVQPADRVLEIGFGPGLAVAELVRAGAGHVYGIDHSGVMLRQASRRNAAAIRAGRVTLINASADQLPAALDGPSTLSSPSTPSGSGPRPPNGSPSCAGGSHPAGALPSHPSPAAPAPRRARPAAPPMRSRTCCGAPASRR